MTGWRMWLAMGGFGIFLFDIVSNAQYFFMVMMVGAVMTITVIEFVARRQP